MNAKNVKIDSRLISRFEKANIKNINAESSVYEAQNALKKLGFSFKVSDKFNKIEGGFPISVSYNKMLIFKGATMDMEHALNLGLFEAIDAILFELI